MNNKWVLQIFFWVLNAGFLFGISFTIMPTQLALLSTFINMVFFALVFYVNTLFLFPRYYHTTNSSKYLLMSFVFIILLNFLMVQVEYYFIFSHRSLPEELKHPKIMIGLRSFFWHLIMVMVGTVYLIQQRLRKQLIISTEILEDKLSTELKFLKSQINPHFLFNALNNIYSLTYMKSEKAPESILKLSDMLRYVIEDCGGEDVSLSSEVEYIKNYIAFQKMKTPEIKNIKFKYEKDGQNRKISPMLFMPFIENSFKYSKIEDFDDAFIEIEIIAVGKERLNFHLSNSIPEIGRARPGAGTGISNVKHRLNILYPGKHTLKIEDRDNRFNVNLEIDTNENPEYNN